MGAVLSRKDKVSGEAPEGAAAQAERRAALFAYGCCKRRRERGPPLGFDPVDAEAPQCEPSISEKAPQESGGCEAARGRLDSDDSTAILSEGRSRWSTDDTCAGEGRSRWSTDDTCACEGRSRWSTDDAFACEGRSRWSTDDTSAGEGRSRWSTDETFAAEGCEGFGAEDALAAEGQGRFGADGALFSQGRPAFGTEGVVSMFDAIPEASAEAGAASTRGFSEESATDVGIVAGASREPGAMTARAFSKESAACVSRAASGASREPGAMTARTFSKESAACVSRTTSGASTEPGAIVPSAFSTESEAMSDPVFRWALSGREIDVADLTASDTVEEAREKIATAIGSSARLLRLLGPDGRPLEGESAIGAGGLVYGRDPDEVEREESAAAKRAAHDALASLMRGW